MVKKDFVALVAEKANTTKKNAGELVDATFDALYDVIVSGDSFMAAGLGTFKTVEVKETVRRNPNSGETFTDPAHKVVKFKVSSNLKQRVKNELV